MKLYNTLSRSIEDFKPIDGQTARVYTCGPTVYNRAHIGNLTAYIYSDILERALLLAGFAVKRVMNLTDIDDKTIRTSHQRYPDLEPLAALKKLTSQYEQAFFEDMKAVGNLVESVKFVRATDSINDIKTLIRRLLKAKAAYIAEDGIYFDIRAYARSRRYGQLSKIDAPSQLRSRIDNDEYDKEAAQDFALWKRQKAGEPAWDFEVDGQDLAGRPGWHIECSAMSVKNLGQPFDIHTGGVDHIFPHHENEIAQSTAGDQPEKLANFFVHSEHLLVDGHKMAKSANNFYTLDDIASKGYSPLDFRLLVLQSHYQNSSNFTWSNLQAAHNRLRAWQNLAELRHQVPDVDDDGQQAIVANLLEQAKAQLLNNLNIPEALKYLDQAIGQLATNPLNISHTALANIFGFIKQNLGLDIYDLSPDLPDDVKELIQVRQVERASGNYGRADEIRDALLSQGVIIKDIDGGLIWNRK